jgi:hypothetical protein
MVREQEKLCNNQLNSNPCAEGMGSPISKETFLRRARARFADHYDYGQMLYKSYKTPIQIRCTIHPVKLISITPEKHLQTSGGCKYCLRESRIRMLERELGREAAVREPMVTAPKPLETAMADAAQPQIPGELAIDTFSLR